MAKQITAQRTREICSYARRALLDEDYRLFQTEDTLFDALNKCINQICKDAHVVIKPDIIFDLVPNQIEYDTINLVDTPQAILQMRSITILSPDGTESKPLTLLTRNDFQNKRTDTSISIPKYYFFDGERIYIQKPYSIIGYRARVRANRLPTYGERAGYETDPATPILYDEYLKAGTVYEAGNTRVELLEKINFPFYESEWKKYMTAKAKPLSVETPSIPFNEMNS